MDTRELKAMQIAATTKLRRTAEAWIVPSQSGQRTPLRVIKTEWVGETPEPTAPTATCAAAPTLNCVSNLASTSWPWRSRSAARSLTRVKWPPER